MHEGKGRGGKHTSTFEAKREGSKRKNRSTKKHGEGKGKNRSTKKHGVGIEPPVEWKADCLFRDPWWQWEVGMSNGYSESASADWCFVSTCSSTVPLDM
jgi:hypothetical protein